MEGRESVSEDKKGEAQRRFLGRSWVMGGNGGTKHELGSICRYWVPRICWNKPPSPVWNCPNNNLLLHLGALAVS